MSAFTQFARTSERPGMSEAELQAMALVVRRFPSGPNAVRHAAALALNGRPTPATDVLRPVCKMSRAAACEEMKTLWRTLGERHPVIAEVSWPID